MSEELYYLWTFGTYDPGGKTIITRGRTQDEAWELARAHFEDPSLVVHANYNPSWAALLYSATNADGWLHRKMKWLVRRETGFSYPSYLNWKDQDDTPYC